MCVCVIIILQYDAHSVKVLSHVSSVSHLLCNTEKLFITQTDFLKEGKSKIGCKDLFIQIKHKYIIIVTKQILLGFVYEKHPKIAIALHTSVKILKCTFCTQKNLEILLPLSFV